MVAVKKVFFCVISWKPKFGNKKEWLREMVNVKPVQLGKTTRMSFGKIQEVLDMPNLIEIQKNSYEWFL